MNKEESKYATLDKPKTKEEKWAEYVERSGGSAMFLPEKFLEEAKALEKKRKEFNDLLQKVVSEKELDLQMETQSFFYGLRKHLKENGKDAIFYKEIGWNQDAADEGIFVINIIDPTPRR